MSAASIQPTGEASFVVEGVLDFTTVAALAAQGERLFIFGGQVEVDLQRVSAANSAGLALLLEWLDLARRRKVFLRFRNLPDSLDRLARLTSVFELLPLRRRGSPGAPA